MISKAFLLQPVNALLSAKQMQGLRKPAVFSIFFTGLNPVVFTENIPVKTRYFRPFFNGTG
jgi:hypothetical protein